MRNWMIVAAVLCVAPVAGAQDAPKEAPKDAPKEEPVLRHVNKITAAAQAAFDKVASLTYSPLKLGLKDLSGAVKMEMEGSGDSAGRGMGAMGKMDLVFAVTFKAPSDLKVELKDAPGKEEAEKAGGGMGARMMKGMGEGMSLAVQRILHGTLEGYVPASDTEFDADAKVENGVTTILLTTYLKGVEMSREEITLDMNGIPSMMVSTPKIVPDAPSTGRGGRGLGMGPADGKSTVKFAYAKEGDLFRLEKMTIEGGGPGGAMEAKLDYADAGNFKVVRSWQMAPANGPFKFGFKFSELIVNGKTVNLPAEGAAPGEKPAEKKDDAKEPGKGE